MFKAGQKYAPLPTVQEMDALVESMYQLIREINDARLHGGWLAQALPRREPLQNRPPQRDESGSPDCLLVHGASLVQIATGVTTEFRA